MNHKLYNSEKIFSIEKRIHSICERGSSFGLVDSDSINDHPLMINDH